MYQSKLASPAVDRFFQALLTLQTQEDCYRFFEDVATIGELNAMAQRFQVAEPLAAGESYPAIAEKTGASTATISRVNKCLNYGSDGYKHALERLGE